MKRVLIVDDSPNIRDRIALLLSESPQIQVVGEASSGFEAIEAVQRLRPDAVVLDINLPDRSGITLLKIFKAFRPRMIVIMMSNQDDTRYRQQCRRLGADHFLSKSLEFEKVVEAVIADPVPYN